MARKVKLRRPPHLNYVATLPNKTYTTVILLEEIAVFDMPTTIPDNTFKTPFIDATVNETLR